MDGFQLDLFSWDIIEIGRALELLSGFDLEGAKTIFEEVLSKIPDNRLAKIGKEMVGEWEETLQRLESLEREEAMVFLWKHIKGYPFSGEHGPGLFKRSLMERIVMLMAGNSSLYIEPDLCVGCLLLKLGFYEKAEKALNDLLETHPCHGRLLGYLGDALWMQGKKSEATEFYAKAFLLAPFEVSLEEICDMELLEIIRDEGADMAPIYGWLRGTLPLLDIEAELYQMEGSDRVSRDNKGLKSYIHLYAAEEARQKGYKDQMLSSRGKLRREAPEVFDVYMEYLRSLSF